MTMHELEALLQQHCPSAPPHLAQQGRALVTPRSRVTSGAGVTPEEWYWWQKPHPCECGCGKTTPRHKKYFDRAHKQKAYRQRKKNGKAA